MSSPYTLVYIVPFSRRNIETMERWAAKPSLSCMETETENEIMDKVKWYKSDGRYKAINLQNDNTIEFRLFRGTLKLNTFIASLQFVVVSFQNSYSRRSEACFVSSVPVKQEDSKPKTSVRSNQSCNSS